MPEPIDDLVRAAPTAVLPARQPRPAWPLHGTESSRRIEAALAATLPAHTLMQRAGLAAARLAQAVAPHARSAWIAAGPGNNGGDGLETALHLRRRGWDVQVTLAGDAQRLPDDASRSLARALAAGVRVDAELPQTLAPQAIVVDALLGIGVNRAAEGRVGAAIERINEAARPVLAVDLPSGLPSDGGFLASEAACVRATWTLSVLTLKPGLFTGHGRDHAGQVWFDDLGAGSSLDATDLWAATAPPDRPQRLHAQHKGSFADTVVVGGAPGMTGAALLAGRAALHAGAGRVYVRLLDGGSIGVDAAAPELMLRPDASLDDPQVTVVCGCGGGVQVRSVLPTVLRRAGALVLDADALNAIAGDAMLAALLGHRGVRGAPTVLTPHPLEAARLLAVDTQSVQRDRVGQARALSTRFACTVVLKGSGSIIASPGCAALINTSGNAALATPGTGDVLAGLIGARLSQGLPPHDAARLAVFEHGAAADRWAAARGADRALPASVLIEML